MFYPVVRKDDVIQKSVNDFIDRLFGGDPIPLVQYLADHKKIDASDIEKLKNLIREGK